MDQLFHRIHPRARYFYGQWKDRAPFYIMVVLPMFVLFGGIAYVISQLDVTNGLPDRIWGLLLAGFTTFMWHRVLPVGQGHTKVVRAQGTLYWLQLAIALVSTKYIWDLVQVYLAGYLLKSSTAPHFIQMLSLFLTLALPLIAVLINVHWIPVHIVKEMADGLKIQQRRNRNRQTQAEFERALTRMAWKAAQRHAVDPETGDDIGLRPWKRDDYVDLTELMVNTSDAIEELGESMRNLVEYERGVDRQRPTEPLVEPDEDVLENYTVDRIRRSRGN